MTRRPAPRPAPAPEGRVLTARSPVDVLAAVPVVLGFEPSDSVVMLTFGGAHTFHARVDLAPPDELGAMTDMLLEPARRHGVRSVVLVVYTPDATAARRALRLLERSFVGSGIDVAHTLRADGTRWYGPGGPVDGVPYDLTTHPFRVDSVVQGVVTHGSREALADTLRSDAAATAPLAAAATGRVAYEASDVASCVAGHVERGSTFDDHELVAVALGLREERVRDAAWVTLRRTGAAAHVLLWSDAVRRLPPPLVGGPASVLAFAAWLSGHGALAWCAVDRACESEPENTLAALVGDLLEGAVPPAVWEESLGPA